MRKLTKNITAIYLNENELSSLYQLNLSNYPKLEKVRDLFIFLVHTGLKFGDLQLIRPDNFKINLQGDESKKLLILEKDGSFLRFGIPEIADKILIKYDGQLPAPQSVEITNGCLKEICRQVDCLNKLVMIEVTIDGIKELQAFKKFEVISVHASRKSFMHRKEHLLQQV